MLTFADCLSVFLLCSPRVLTLLSLPPPSCKQVFRNDSLTCECTANSAYDLNTRGCLCAYNFYMDAQGICEVRRRRESLAGAAPTAWGCGGAF